MEEVCLIYTLRCTDHLIEQRLAGYQQEPELGPSVLLGYPLNVCISKRSWCRTNSPSVFTLSCSNWKCLFGDKTVSAAFSPLLKRFTNRRSGYGWSKDLHNVWKILFRHSLHLYFNLMLYCGKKLKHRHTTKTLEIAVYLSSTTGWNTTTGYWMQFLGHNHGQSVIQEKLF